jgi:hypothetical protein
MAPELITAITALVVAIGGLLTTVVTLVNVLRHGTAIEATRQAVNGQANELHAAIGTMQVENAKRAAESS